MKRHALSLGLVLLLSACGGGTSPTEPTPPAAPPAAPSPPPASPNRWSISGRIVTTLTGMSVAGATLVFADGLGTVSTDASGAFRFESTTVPRFTPYQLTLSAPGYVTRDAQVMWQRGDRTDVVVDVIRDSAPFSLAFYRQLVRNGYEEPGNLQILRRWTEPPKFYVRTIDETTGRAVEPEVLTVVQDWLRRGLDLWTQGRWQVSVLETGTDARPDTVGWVMVRFIRTGENICGRAVIGGNPGWIVLNNDRCNCGSVKVPPSTVVHELGHSLGFYHVPPGSGVMRAQNPGGCFPTEPSVAEIYHAAIAHQRSRGSRDIDTDPTTPPGLLKSIVE